MPPLDWLEASLKGILPALWMSLGVGLPWALALLPALQWSSRILVLALALALGPAFTSAWMLLLGLAGAQFDLRLLTPEALIAGSVVIAVFGFALAWRKRDSVTRQASEPHPFAFDEKLIIAMIGAALALRWIHIAWWSFSAYDALWVYGYQARLYFLEGMIPHAIDYYPQFLQTQFAWSQILIGAINDHAARMCLPLLHLGSILATYLLGAQLVNRRAGLCAAALWSLHPYVAQWSTVGDLEIPLAFSFTLAAVFFLRAWQNAAESRAARHDALLAGLLLGIALYTKPTAGAFLWGALLLLALEIARTRLRFRELKPRLWILIRMGLAALPLGGIWYLRNLLLGHEMITLPDAYWLTQARRSGDYLAWLLLALLLVWVAMALSRRVSRRWLSLGFVGIGIALAGALASTPALFPARFDPPASYITPFEAAAIVFGALLAMISLVAGLRGSGGASLIKRYQPALWAIILALPYFATFYFSYSYHYRLGFAITPLLILPSAIALSQILSRERVSQWRRGIRRFYFALLALICLPGIFAVAVDHSWSTIWLLNAYYDSDLRKYQAMNPSLMEVVYGLGEYVSAQEKTPVVLAPGEERLPFFYPQLRINDQPLHTLAQVEALGATHFVFGAKARQAYAEAGIDPMQTQLIAALGRRDLFELKKLHSDGTFSYELYEISDLSSRFDIPGIDFISRSQAGEIRFGERLRLLAADAYPQLLVKDTPITLRSAWQAAEPITRDLAIEVALHDLDRAQSIHHWRFTLGAQRHGYYSTRWWQPGEAVKDTTVIKLPAETRPPEGENYVLLLRIIDKETGAALPLTIAGESAGDTWTLERRHTIAR